MTQPARPRRDGVIERPQAARIQVTAAPNPLRGISQRLRLRRQLHRAGPRTGPRRRPLLTRLRTATAQPPRSPSIPRRATITEVEGSHVIMISRPDAVADVIKTAAAAVTR